MGYSDQENTHNLCITVIQCSLDLSNHVLQYYQQNNIASIANCRIFKQMSGTSNHHILEEPDLRQKDMLVEKYISIPSYDIIEMDQITELKEYILFNHSYCVNADIEEDGQSQKEPLILNGDNQRSDYSEDALTEFRINDEQSPLISPHLENEDPESESDTLIFKLPAKALPQQIQTTQTQEISQLIESCEEEGQQILIDPSKVRKNILQFFSTKIHQYFSKTQAVGEESMQMLRNCKKNKNVKEIRNIFNQRGQIAVGLTEIFREGYLINEIMNGKARNGLNKAIYMYECRKLRREFIKIQKSLC